MEGHFSTGQRPQWAVVPIEEEEEEKKGQAVVNLAMNLQVSVKFG